MSDSYPFILFIFGRRFFIHSEVAVAPSGDWGRVQSFRDDGGVFVVLDHGPTELFERWCLQPLPDVAAQALDVQDSICFTCGDQIPSGWTLGSCDHLMCGACRCTWLWSQYASYEVPLRCPQCREVCLPEVPDGIGRSMRHYWEEIKQDLGTSKTFSEFLSDLNQRINELGDIATRTAHARELINSPQAVRIAYCQVPKLRISLYQ